MAPKLTSADIPAGSLAGKVAVVTGGNTGIGLISVQQLARAGARVFMASRTESKARDAIAAIEPEEVRDRVEFVKLDLAELDSARTAAKTIMEKTPDRLDIVILNAGVMMLPYELTKDNVEIQLQSNHLGHFVFVETLLPLLLRTGEQTQDVRVVTVASVAHNMVMMPSSHIRWRSLKDFNRKHGPELLAYGSFRRYSYSKLANILHAKELERRYGSKGVHGIPCHPGVVRSALWNNIQKNHPIFWKVWALFLNPVFTEPVEGATSQLYAATSPEVKEKALWGMYIKPGGQVEKPQWSATNGKVAKELWELSEAVANGTAPAN